LMDFTKAFKMPYDEDMVLDVLQQNDYDVPSAFQKLQGMQGHHTKKRIRNSDHPTEKDLGKRSRVLGRDRLSLPGRLKESTPLHAAIDLSQSSEEDNHEVGFFPYSAPSRLSKQIHGHHPRSFDIKAEQHAHNEMDHDVPCSQKHNLSLRTDEDEDNHRRMLSSPERIVPMSSTDENEMLFLERHEGRSRDVLAEFIHQKMTTVPENEQEMDMNTKSVMDILDPLVALTSADTFHYVEDACMKCAIVAKDEAAKEDIASIFVEINAVDLLHQVLLLLPHSQKLERLVGGITYIQVECII
jgi:hypothetical protein